MSWSRELLDLEELGGRAWSNMAEERWASFRSQDNAHRYRDARGRFRHPLGHLLEQRIMVPEWTWDPSKVEPRVRESVDEIRVNCEEAEAQRLGLR